MKNIILAVGVFVVTNVLANVTVSDIQVFSGYPWKEVAIGYTISGNADNKTLGVVVSAEDKNSGKRYECETPVEASVIDGEHIITWNAAAGGAKFKSDNVVFTVKVAEPPYCVIDLSGGPSAEYYPVNVMGDIPNGVWSQEYETTKLVLRRIEAGAFKMQNIGNVILTKPFYIGVFEVTQKQWELVMGSNPSPIKGDTYPLYNVNYVNIRGSSAGAGWPESASVDSSSFIGKLRAKTGINTFDLPTEAQWEYACRAGTTTTYYWGDSEDGDYMHCSSRSPVSVGAKKPNAWGLYGMSGNVMEWCLDWFGELSYGVDPKGPFSGADRVARGGSWSFVAPGCTSSKRWSKGPSTTDTASLNGYLGFRIARHLD